MMTVTNRMMKVASIAAASLPIAIEAEAEDVGEATAVAAAVAVCSVDETTTATRHSSAMPQFSASNEDGHYVVW